VVRRIQLPMSQRLQRWPALVAGYQAPQHTYEVRGKQGIATPLVDLRVVSDKGEAPWDGTTMGELQVREFAREQEQTVEIFLDRWAPPELDQWFEQAIDCCAFLAWSLSSRGASIHFRSNGFQFRQPEDGDIYAILRFLALVRPQASAAPEPPLGETTYQIVFSADPQRLRDAGWMGARVLGPENPWK